MCSLGFEPMSLCTANTMLNQLPSGNMNTSYPVYFHYKERKYCKNLATMTEFVLLLGGGRTIPLPVESGSSDGIQTVQRSLGWAEAVLKWVFVGFPTLVITHGEALVRGNDPHPGGWGGSTAAWGSEAGKQRPVGVKPKRAMCESARLL